MTAKILLISETRDAATPYSGALAVRRLFPTASLVAGVGGTTHASSLSGVPCVDNTVGDLPAHRRRADAAAGQPGRPALRPAAAAAAERPRGAGRRRPRAVTTGCRRSCGDDLMRAQRYR